MGEVFRQNVETDVLRVNFATRSNVACVAGSLAASVVRLVDLDARQCNSGIISAATVIDRAKAGRDWYLWLFDRNPVNSSFVGSGAFSLSAADFDAVLPGCPAAITHKYSDSATSYAAVDGKMLGFRGRSAAELYAALTVDGGTYTANGTTNLMLALALLQD